MQPINFKKVLEKYKSGWVALKPNTNNVVASGKTLKEVLEASEKKGVDNPAVFKPAPCKELYVG